MSTISKEQANNNPSPSPNIDPVLTAAEPQNLLKIKRDREDSEEDKCQECDIQGDEKVMTFTSSNQIMTFVFENILSLTIDNKIKNDLFTSTLPNKSLNLKFCHDCLAKTVITKGFNYLLGIPSDLQSENKNFNNSDTSVEQNEKDSKDSVKILPNKKNSFDSFYKIYVNFLINQLEKINDSLTKNSIEAEQVLNRMAVHLILNKDNAQFQKFNDEMTATKNLLQNDRKAFSDLLKNCQKSSEISEDISKIIDREVMKNINEEKLNKLINSIKQLANEPYDKENTASNKEEEENTSEQDKSKKKDSVNQNSPQTPKINPIGDSVSVGEQENNLSSYSLNEFKVQPQPIISIESGNRVTKKKNYIIKSVGPIHEANSAIPLNTTTTPITQMNSKILENQCNTGGGNQNTLAQNAILSNLQMKMNPQKAIGPQGQGIPNYPPSMPQNPLQVLQSIQSQMNLPPQGPFPNMYAPNLFNGNMDINLMTMKSMFPQPDNKIQPNMYQPQNPMFPNMNYNHPFCDINQLYLQQKQQEKMGQKINLPPGMGGMGGMPNFPGMPQIDSYYDPSSQGMGDLNGGNNMNLMDIFNQMAKQKDLKGKGYAPNMGNNDNNNNKNN